MTAEELLERYAAGERNFAGVELGGSKGKNIRIHLSSTDLRGINLSGANLEMVNFALSDLSGSRFFGAYLSYSCLIRTNFTEADMRYSTINWSDVREANFTNTKMEGSDLSSSNLKKTIWRSNNLSSAILICTDLTDAEGWKGGGGDLYNALFWGTTLPDGNVVEGPERHP